MTKTQTRKTKIEEKNSFFNMLRKRKNETILLSKVVEKQEMKIEVEFHFQSSKKMENENRI